MRLIIIGAVAAGTSAAAKARRNREDIEIVIYEKDSFISYSGCGMPYYIGNIVKHSEELTPRNAAFFKSKYNVDILILHEVIGVYPEEKSLKIRNLSTGEIFSDTYDKLIIATGASAVVPPITGVEFKHVFSLRTMNDMYKIKAYIDNHQIQSAVIVGTGFIGLEVSENLIQLGIKVTLIEKLPQVTPGLDADVAIHVKKHLEEHGITVITGAEVIKITEHSVILADGQEIETQFVLLSIGVRPNTQLAVDAGIELGVTKAIKVDKRMKTSITDIYACGDCVEQYHVVTGRAVYRPLGSTANKTGRIAGDVVTGGNLEFRGILGTGIFKIFDMTVAMTGLSEKEAIMQGYDIAVCHNSKPNKPEYMNGEEMMIKGIADKSSGRILGVQIVGGEGADKRVDVFATAITFEAKVEDLFHLDLAYAPPFSTTKDPVMYTGMILDNAIHKGRPLITAEELDTLVLTGQKHILIDARVEAQYEKGHMENASNIPHHKLRDELEELDHDAVAVTYCNKGITGNAAQNILINNGFKEVYNLSGGYKQYSKVGNRGLKK